MSAELWAVYDGHTVGLKTQSIIPKMNSTIDLSVKPATIKATVLTPWGTPAPGLAVDLVDLTNGRVTTLNTSTAGEVTFTNLFAGQYHIRSNSSAFQLNVATINVAEGRTYLQTLTLAQAMTVQGQAIYKGANGTVPLPYARIGFISPTFEYWATADANGNYAVTLPQQNYTIYGISNIYGRAVVALIKQGAANSVTKDLPLWNGWVLSGNVLDNNKTVSGVKLVVNNSAGGTITGITNSTGGFRFVLLNENYTVYAAKGSRVAWEVLPIGEGNNISLGDGRTVGGKVWVDLSYDGLLQSSEGRANVTIRVQDVGEGLTLTIVSGSNGAYNVTLPVNGTYTFLAALPNFETVNFSFNELSSNQTRNIEMVPTNRSVSGTVDLNGSGLANVWLDFEANSGWGTDTRVHTDAVGNYAASLRPGNYTITLSQNVSGDDSTQYQLVEPRDLTIAVGQVPTLLDLEACVRYKVNGTVSSSEDDPFSAKLSFSADDLDSVSLNTNGSFSLYLREGNYSLYIISEIGLDREAYFDLVAVTGPLGLDLTTQPAERITVDLRFKGTPMLQPIPVTLVDPVSGAVFQSKTNPTGSIAIYMPSGGNYNLSADLRILAYPSLTATEKKYMRYQAEEDLFFNTTKNLAVELTQSFDNSTVTGLPAGATVEMQAQSSTAMDIRFETSPASAEIAPGNYTIYAHGASDLVYLGFVTVPPYATIDLGIVMQQGYRVNGTLRVAGSPEFGNMTISQGDASYVTDTDPSGQYLVFLPEGTFVGTGAALIPENGVPVTYAASKTLLVDGAMQVDFDLTKQVAYSVKLTWNNTKGNVSNGESISYIVTLANTGNMVDSYELSSSTLNWNITFTYNGVTNKTAVVENLTFGTGGKTNITVTLTPSFKVNVIHSPVFITAVSTKGSGATTSLNLDVNINPRNQVNLTYLRPLAQSGKDNYTYQILVENTGNQDDQYNLDLTNLAAFNGTGWQVKVRVGETGNFTSFPTIFNVTAGRNKTVQVTLIRMDGNATANVTVELEALSLLHNNTDALVFQPDFSDPSIPEDGFTVSGDDVASEAPGMSNDTIALMVACALLAALLVFLMIKKEVFSRRKR